MEYWNRKIYPNICFLGKLHTRGEEGTKGSGDLGVISGDHGLPTCAGEE